MKEFEGQCSSRLVLPIFNRVHARELSHLKLGGHIPQFFYMGGVVLASIFQAGPFIKQGELLETTWFHFRVLIPWCRLVPYGQYTSLKPFELETCWGCVLILGDVGHQVVTTKIKSGLNSLKPPCWCSSFLVKGRCGTWVSIWWIIRIHL